MIPLSSSSYPILAAAQAAGVDYGVALAWIEIWRYPGVDRAATTRASARLVGQADASYSRPTVDVLRNHLAAAIDDGRIYWPALARAPGAQP